MQGAAGAGGVADESTAIVDTDAGAGAGVAYLGMRLANYGARIVDAVVGFVKAIFNIINSLVVIGFIAPVFNF